jgi:hypothetical protein
VAPRRVEGPVERTVFEPLIHRHWSSSRFVDFDSIDTAPDGTGR